MCSAVHNACLNAIAVSFAQTPLACLLARPLCTDRINWQTGKTVAAEIEPSLKCTRSLDC